MEVVEALLDVYIVSMIAEATHLCIAPSFLLAAL